MSDALPSVALEPATETTAESASHRRQLRFKWPRKCSKLPRARSITAKQLTMAERQEAAGLFEPDWDAARPRTRGECEGQPRPCPWVSCRYNLYLDVADNGSVKINFPGREPDEMPATGSCVLDVADRVAQGEFRYRLSTLPRKTTQGGGVRKAEAAGICLDDIGKLMNLSIERVRQLSSLALQGARVQTMRRDGLGRVRLPLVPA